MLPELPTDARVLIVDDQEANIRLLREVLNRAGGPRITAVTDPLQVVHVVKSFQPDLVLLDLHMQPISGYNVLQQLREGANADPSLPVLVVTADATRFALEKALTLGASDFLAKPLNATEVVLRARNLLETRRLMRLESQQNELLEARVRQRTRELMRSQAETLERLALVGDFRDDATGRHSRRVGNLAVLVARAMGKDDAELQRLRLAAPLHDIGKVGVIDSVLRKPGPLSPVEFDAMRQHVHFGDQILAGSTFPVLQMARDIARTHHERWDGQGYLGLAAHGIPEPARIVAVADVFDALTDRRPYKQAWPAVEAAREVHGLRGSAFDPQVVDAFLSLHPERWDESDIAQLLDGSMTGIAA